MDSRGYNQGFDGLSGVGSAEAWPGAAAPPGGVSLKEAHPPKADSNAKPQTINASRVIRVLLNGIVRNSW